MTTTTLEHCGAQIELKDATEHELADAFGADDGMDAQILAELKRRDDKADRERARIRALRSDPLVAEWTDAAHAQMIHAEAECAGNLVRRDSHVTDAWSLWSGPLHWAMAHASEELRNYWDKHGRVPTVTEYRDAVRRERQISAEERTDHDELARDVPAEIRSGGARPGSESRMQADTRPQCGAADPVRRDAARAAARPGDPGPVRYRGGQVNEITTEPEVTARTERAMARAERAREVAERSQAAQESVTAPGAPVVPAGGQEGSQGAVAVRPAGVVRSREPISGEKVLWWARGYLGRFIMWPSERALDAAALWAAHCHARDADGMLVWQSSPRALFSSAEPGSGKSAAMRAVSRICPSPAVFTEPSEPAVAHAIGKEHATLFLDEADVLFQTQRKAAIRAIINDGYTPEGSWPRVRNGSVERIPTFGALAMAGLDKLDSGTSGSMKATLTRCIRWRMRRAPDDYRAPRMDAQARLVAATVTDRLTAWAQQESGYLATAVPDVPEGIGNRDAELWEPLLVVADAAGGRWPQAAREACEEFVNAAGIPDDDAEREAMLEDVMNSWGIEGSDL